MNGQSSTLSVGILHPGSMGAAVAKQLRHKAIPVYWFPEGRSALTEQRARNADLIQSASIAEFVEHSDVIVSLCPPASAYSVAEQIASTDFSGIYLEANAVSPMQMERIATMLESPNRATVDGSVIGSPPSATKFTRLYLSGPDEPTAVVARLFTDTHVDARVLSGGIGKASALKMAYSSFQKSSRVIAAIAHALAAEHGLEDELLDIALLRESSYLAEPGYNAKVVDRAWRWSPELAEVADTLRNVGLPTELAKATSHVLYQWSDNGR